MNKNEILGVVESQRKFFRTGKTKGFEYRLRLLKKLYLSVSLNLEAVHTALKNDLNKPEVESFSAESFYVLAEIEYAISHLKGWMKRERKSSPVLFWPMRTTIRPEPLGNILIISPWNYPFQLCMAPLVGAIAAGNTVIIKPSEMAPATSRVVSKIIEDTFTSSEVSVVEGGIPEITWLLEERFDHIFYTGNAQVAKIIMNKASRHLTPVTLELGGKSPTVVFGEVDMEVTVRRILFGKFYNMGQTCVSPDYVLVDHRLKESFVKKCIEYLERVFKETPDKFNSKIINISHFKRLHSLLGKDEILYGGVFDEQKLFIHPTILNATETSLIMQEEIFGPILPVIGIGSIEEALNIINKKEKPLAIYLFSKDCGLQERFIRETSSGAIVLNDTIIHQIIKNIPFGGVGQSGMGVYHGYFTFKTFSHFKPILKRSFCLDNPLRYPPYSKFKLSIIKRILAFFS